MFASGVGFAVGLRFFEAAVAAGHSQFRHSLFLQVAVVQGEAHEAAEWRQPGRTGLPQPIIERAKQILGKLEGGSHNPDGPAAPQENAVATPKKPRTKKTASAEEVGGPVTQQVELELF